MKTSKEKKIRKIISSGVNWHFEYNFFDMMDNLGTQCACCVYDNVKAFVYDFYDRDGIRVKDKDGNPYKESIPISYEDMVWFKDLYDKLNR